MDPHLEQHPHHTGRRQRHRWRNAGLFVVAGSVAAGCLVGAELSGRPVITGLFAGILAGTGNAGGTDDAGGTGNAGGTGHAAGPGKAAKGQDPHSGHGDQAGRQEASRSKGADGPPPGLEDAEAPLGRPRPPKVASNSYAFLAVNDDGTPVGYSPCRPLHYAVNADIAPAGSSGLIGDSVAKISSATGIKFIFDGPTKEQPGEDRDAYQPSVYGERWAPLLVSWTTPEAAPALSGDVIGTGGSTMYSFGNGPKSYVTGSLELDTPQIRELLQDEGGRAYVSAVIQHELGHVMGLDHVNDPLQLMYPEIGAPDGLASGDLNGLYKLGTAACRKDL